VRGGGGCAGVSWVVTKWLAKEHAVSGERGITTGKVITGVSGSPGSLRALRFAAELARARGAALVPVLVWLPPGGDLADRRYPSARLREIWRTSAAAELAQAVELALGGAPDDVVLEPLVLRGEAGAALVATATEPGDVLVVGTGRRGLARRLLLRGGVARFCLAHAACPVVAVPPSGLAEASRGIRGWALRHRSLTPEAARPDAAHSTEADNRN
jgi:nucleotide-binding universal stress UspA family protein